MYQKLKEKNLSLLISSLIVFLLISVLVLTIVDSVRYQKKLSGQVLSYSPDKVAQLTKPVTITSLKQVFEKKDNNISNLSTKDKIVLISTGDVIPARSVNYQSSTRENFLWPFEKTADFLQKADLTVINLESPLIEDCPLTNSGMIFCGDQRHIDGLTYAGVDIATLENNHIDNFGKEGRHETISHLIKANIDVVEKNNPLIKNVKEKKLAFLAFNDLAENQATIDEKYLEELTTSIQQVAKQADIVVVSFHWGAEYTSYPSDRLRELAHLAIDSGADLILGNHPHWIQAIEFYKNKLIIYAHGNFIFDQMWSEKTKQGIIAKLTFYQSNSLIDVEFIPIHIYDFGQPDFASGIEKELILEEMKSISEQINRTID